ncbi:MAG: hypothetical protein M3Z85_00870 [Acidobacteriota bacterium]|nr:hypothetical protein [Acidobacteriota bacterium]
MGVCRSKSNYHALGLEVLHRRLHEAAARQGCSARQMILRSIEHAVEGAELKRPSRRFEPDPALIAATGKPIDNAQICELIEFP